MTESPYLRTSNLERAFLDVSVLRSRQTSAVLLSLADQDIFDPRWTQQVIDQLRQARAADKGLDRHIARMNSAFDRAMSEPPPQGLQDEVRAAATSRHVLAGALQTKSQVLVTGNLQAFYPPSTGPYAMQVEDVNQFLSRKLEEHPHRVLGGLQRMLDGDKRGPSTMTALIAALDVGRDLRPFAEKLSATVLANQHGSIST